MSRVTPALLSKVPALSTGKVENVAIATANTEQSHTFPVNTKTLLVQIRGTGVLKYAFDAGQSGIEYASLYPGAFYSESGIGVPNTTIYFQSPNAGLVLELVSWS